MVTKPEEEAKETDERNDLESNNRIERYRKCVLGLTNTLVENCFEPLFLHIANHPYLYIITILVISITLPTIAITTNSLQVVTDIMIIGLPPNAYPRRQFEWVEQHYVPPRPSIALLHSSGGNILIPAAIRAAFEIGDVLPTIPNFATVCGEGEDLSVLTLCQFQSVTLFWQNRSEFENDIENMTSTQEEQDYILNRISSPTFWNGKPAVRARILGHIQEDASTGKITFAKSLAITLSMEKSRTVEIDFVEKIQSASIDEKFDLTLDLFSYGYTDKELQAPINDDLPLVGIAIITMATFTALAMTRWKKNSKGQRFVTSNFALGLGATITVILSMATGYSFCSLCGYPITNVTQVLPFVLIGIGLDDSFILVGAYYDSSPTLSFPERLKSVARDACPSITLTSLTDCAAFALGSSSNIPAIRWFGFYAVVCISIDFLYQVTFFVALLVLDHERSKKDRLDCLCCFQAAGEDVNHDDDDDDDDDTETPQVHLPPTEESKTGEEIMVLSREQSVREAPQSDGFMRLYGKLLMKPMTKGVVIVVFLMMFVVGAVFASTVRVHMDLMDLTADNAVSDRFVEADRKYFANDDGLFSASIYYHDVDVSDAGVRQQMLDFRNDLLALGSDDYPATPSFVEDLDTFLQESMNVTADLSFREQLDGFLALDEFGLVYNNTIVRTDDGGIDRLVENIIISLDLFESEDQVRFVIDQRQVTMEQPLNQDVGDDGVERMFVYHNDIDVWEHYRMVPREVMMSLILSVVAVGLVCVLLLPHPSGTLFSVIAVVLVDVELVGVIAMAGYTINSITMVLLVMSIGLVADYCLHVVHAFWHVDSMSRNGRVVLCVEKIGKSVFLGGFTTFLGIIGLAFSSGEVFFWFFVVFVAMVLLGLAHGLVLLPVVLSLIGADVVILKESNTMHRSLLHFKMRASGTKSLVLLQQQDQSSGLDVEGDTQVIE